MSSTMHYCYNCGKPVMDDDETCLFCGAPQAEVTGATGATTQQGTYEIPRAANPYQQYQQQKAGVYGGGQAVQGTPTKNKIVAGVLAIIFGWLGIHKFYLGYTSQGIVMLLVSIISFGIALPVMELVGIIEGIMYLVKSDDEFYRTYEAGYKPWF